MELKKQYGLIGKSLSHSFSKNYFETKFSDILLFPNHSYKLFEIPNLKEHFFNLILKKHPLGLNVTVPYKEEIIPFLDSLSIEAEKIGAVNVIKIDYNSHKPILKGYNTDCFGFESSITPLLKPWHTHALILGTGGASLAVGFVLKKLGIEHTYVSRTKNGKNIISYHEISNEVIENNLIIINATPVGMYPKTNTSALDVNKYEKVTSKHLFYDLIYNPHKTEFLKHAEEKGASIKNGLNMLYYQAEKSWDIWSNENI